MHALLFYNLPREFISVSNNALSDFLAGRASIVSQTLNKESSKATICVRGGGGVGVGVFLI